MKLQIVLKFIQKFIQKVRFSSVYRPYVFCYLPVCHYLICFRLFVCLFFRYVSVSRTLKFVSHSLLCPINVQYSHGTYGSVPYYLRRPTAATVSNFHERPTNGLRFCVFSFHPFDVHSCYQGSVGAQLSRRGFSLLNCRKPRTDTWWRRRMCGPHPEICQSWCPVVRCGRWTQQGSYGYYYLLFFNFIPGSICSPVITCICTALFYIIYSHF